VTQRLVAKIQKNLKAEATAWLAALRGLAACVASYWLTFFSLLLELQAAR
jgi:hypothetical protein